MQKTALALLLATTITPLAFAQTEKQEEANEAVLQLEEVTVSADNFSQQIGTQKLDAQKIAKMPSRNGNITDLLRNNPNVTFSNQSNGSNNGGEIRPDEVSFHGEKFYNNNFIIDGSSNNDNLHPGVNNNDRFSSNINAYALPEGGTQSMWLDSHLLKSVEVFDSNISAKYGNFTGGVIKADLKEPDLAKTSGRIFYRTTRDSWADFHIAEKNREAFEKANQPDQQPKFVKQIYGVMLNQPLGDNFALLFQYSKTLSDIDFYHSQLVKVDSNGKSLGSLAEPQKRTNENIILRGIYLPDNGDLWRATVIYSPHKAYSIRPNIYHGEYIAKGGGLQTNVEWEKQFDTFKMKSYFGYKNTGDEIDNASSNYRRYIYTPSFDYRSGNYSPTGGYGKIQTEKAIYTFKQDFELNEFDYAEMQHKLLFGWQVDYATAKYHRANPTANYTYLSGNVNCNGQDECIDGEQYAAQKMLFDRRNVSVNDTDIAAYLEDQLKWKRLQANLGVRLDYNRFFGNTNLAQRLSGSYDLFGDGTTRLVAGFSRYYAKSMLAYKLRQGIGEAQRSSRTLQNGVLSDWSETKASPNSVPTHYWHNRAKTPYSDERMLGISQKLFGTDLTLKWVNRQSRDGLTRDRRYIDGRYYNTLSNYGSSDNNSITLTIDAQAWKNDWVEFDWSFALGRSISKTNFVSYDSSINNTEKVIYRNQLIDADALPPNDFNSPWSAKLTLESYFPKLRLSWTQNLGYTQGRYYREMNESKVQCSEAHMRAICGDYIGEAVEYQDGQAGSEFSLDWRFVYKQPIYRSQYLEFSLDVNNVLNRRSLAKSSGSSVFYKMGRNFWAGVSYNW